MNYPIREEDYIKAIYRLRESRKTVTANAPADELKTKLDSVTDMPTKLKPHEHR